MTFSIENYFDKDKMITIKKKEIKLFKINFKIKHCQN